MTISKCRDENGLFLTDKQAQLRYNMSRAGVMQLAEEARAIIRFGKRLRIDVERCDNYLRREYTE